MTRRVWYKKIKVCFSIFLTVTFILSGCREQQQTQANHSDETPAPAEVAVSDQKDVKNLYEKFIANEITAFDETNTKKYFRDFLLRDVDVQDYSYTYLDMTGDGAPELCVHQIPEMYFFTVNNGNIYHWYTEHNSYSKLLNNGAFLFERHGGAPTHIDYKYYELDETAKVKLSVTFSWWDGATIEFGKVYPDVYMFDDKEVTKEEYEEKTSTYLSIGSDKLVWYDMDGNQKNDKVISLVAF